MLQPCLIYLAWHLFGCALNPAQPGWTSTPLYRHATTSGRYFATDGGHPGESHFRDDATLCNLPGMPHLFGCSHLRPGVEVGRCGAAVPVLAGSSSCESNNGRV